ncbi:MAG: tetratricopeptide repeat protein [Deltaproteobacteria bacterium]|nr:tetratricopeptide repeat protein [Deltaproteobacteria bacterium]
MSRKKKAKSTAGAPRAGAAPFAAPTRWQLGLAVLAIWVAGFAAFSNSFTIAFQFDDLHTIQSNMYIRSLSYIPRYFVDANTYSYRPENSGYRPMSSLACAIAFQLSHLDTWGFHLVKLVEHCLIATLILLLALRLLPATGRAARVPHGRFLAAVFGALVFVTHRANTETVDYITAISTLQAGLFLLLGFYCYLRLRESPPRVAVRWLAASLVCYMASMMSKEEGITLPAVVLLHDWIYSREEGEGYLAALKRRFWCFAKLGAPYALVALAFIVLRTSFQAAVADNSRGNIPRFVYLITQFRSWFHYWSLFFWPVQLNSDNLSFDFSPGLEDWRVWAALSFHVAVWAGAWVAARRHRFVLFAVAWIYVTVLPASSFFPLVEAVNEHRMYIPYMLLAPLAAWGAFSGLASLGGRAVAVAALSAIVLALGAGAYARNEVWQTNISLWEDVYSKNPDSPRALNVLGVSLVNEGQFERAGPMLERCHQLSPGYLPCMVHLSMVYAHYRRYEDGLKLLRYANSLDPDYPHVNFHLGVYYKDYLGRPDEAIPHLQRLIKFTAGRFFQGTLKLADLYIDKGRYLDAMKLADSVLNADNSNGDAWDTLARAEMLSGDLEKSGRIFARLKDAVPDGARYVLDYPSLNLPGEKPGQIAP